MKSQLILSDGTVFAGKSFGAEISTSGEVVFNTGMVGYPESLTDPSYFGQILVLTYPLIGNYGVPESTFWESGKIQVKGLIVQNYLDYPSHYQSERSLAEWLIAEGIPAIQDIDTRSLTTKLRHHGVMLGQLEIESRVKSRELKNEKSRFQTLATSNIYDPNLENVLPFVSRTKIEDYGQGKKVVVLIDCGAKENIIRNLVERKVLTRVVPWDSEPDQWGKFDGVLVSNGPGDPKKADKTIQTIRALLAGSIPVMGICLGNQLLALAAGGDTYKLKFGHRSQNQPVMNLLTNKALITSQNHGFAVDAKSLSSDWQEWFVNLNDGSNEGLRHKKKPFLSAQFHPESAPGPLDANFLFDEFLDLI